MERWDADKGVYLAEHEDPGDVDADALKEHERNVFEAEYRKASDRAREMVSQAGRTGMFNPSKPAFINIRSHIL